MNPMLSDNDCRIAVDRLGDARAAAARARFVAGARDQPKRQGVSLLSRVFSPRMLNSQVTNILTKLGVATRTETNVHAVRDGLI